MNTRSWRSTRCISLNKNSVVYLQPFADLLLELERPELLFLALLLHDTGKGLEGADHVQSSRQLASAAVKRMQLSEEDAETVCFLVAAHLEISSTMRRRDIYDPAAIRELAGKIGTSERLKMLTLLTLADIKAVNPEALTPWKAENLWRLYAGTATYFVRSADQERLPAEISNQPAEKVAALLPEHGEELLKFLEGLPQRYLLFSFGRASGQALYHGKPSGRRTCATGIARHQRTAGIDSGYRRSPRPVPHRCRDSLRLGDGHYQGGGVL